MQERKEIDLILINHVQHSTVKYFFHITSRIIYWRQIYVHVLLHSLFFPHIIE